MVVLVSKDQFRVEIIFLSQMEEVEPPGELSGLQTPDWPGVSEPGGGNTPGHRPQ